MSYLNNIKSRKAINVMIFTQLHLTSECLKLLLESKSEIKVQWFADSIKELLLKVTKNKPDLVLFCLAEHEYESIDILPELFELSPSTKVLVLSDLDGELDQRKVLKLGATGIVSIHQKEEVLIRAIRQVAEGEVWFNHKLIAELLNHSENGGKKQHLKYKGVGKNQELTEREFEVVESIALGFNNKQISKKLFISEATVRHHLSSIYSKLYIEDRLNLVIYAYQNNIARMPTYQ